MTVLRKLRALGYLTSYSHGGRFYTLGERVRFDEQGLYRVNDRCFSRFGSLLNTAEHFVVHSSGGYYASELSRELAVQTKEALLTLVRRQRVARTRVDGLYLHCALDRQMRRDQLMHREQGIDLEMEIAGERCVFEVKTSESDSVRLTPKGLSRNNFTIHRRKSNITGQT